MSSSTTPAPGPNPYSLLAFTLLMQSAVIGVVVYCFGFFAVHWMAEFDSPRSQLMSGYTAMSLVAGLLSPVVGMWIDSYSRRLLVVAGILSFCVGMVLLGFATQAWQVVAIFSCVMAPAMALSGPLVSQTLVASAFTEKRGTALGICALGTSLGGFLMPVVVTHFLESMPWRQVVFALSGLVFVLVLPLALVVIRGAIVRAPAKVPGAPAITNREIYRHSNVYKLALAFFLPSALFVAVLQNIGLQAADLNLTQSQGGLVVALAAGLMALGKFGVGWLADRMSHKLLYTAMTVMVALGMLLMAIADGLYPMIAGGVLMGLSVGGVSPLVGLTVAQQFGAANFGRVMGVVMGTASFSGLAPLLAGWLRDTTGSYETAFLLLIPLVIPAFIAFIKLTPVEEGAKVG